MFWGVILGVFERARNLLGKGLGFHLESKLSRSRDSVLHDWLRMNLGLILTQDGAPRHSAKETPLELNERRIYPIFWPAFSSDLNPIETGMGSDEGLYRKVSSRGSFLV